MLLRNLILAPLVALLTISAAAQPARAQDGQDPGAPAQSAPAQDAATGAAAGEVAIRVEQFGFGGRARVGSWVPVLVSFVNQTERARDIILRIESPDPDGDRVDWQRNVTANAGVKQRAWLYMRLPYSMRSGGALNISAYEAVESGQAYRAGRLLSTTIYPLTSAVLAPEDTELIAVVGRRAAGLRQLSERLGEPYNPLRHGPTEIVAQIEPTDVPDRWWGLNAYETLVWTGGQPQDLRVESAAAIREWVRRGGHLVVVLPAIGEQWTTELNNGLFELLPDVEADRRAEYDLAQIKPLLTRRPAVDLDRDGVVHTLTPRARAEPGQAVRIIDDPAGRCLVARRLVGVGACTLIGVDLTAGPLREQGLPDADAFWNRVLGRRGAAATAQELQTTASNLNYTYARPGNAALDSDFSSVVAQEGRAAVGVLMGFVVFIVYWLVAGPVGFAVLRRARADKHAWLAFLLTSVVFTAVAWTGATLIRPHKVGGSHLTILTHVYGQPVQSARSWMGLLLPAYGDARVSVESGDNAGAGARSNLISPWDGPQGGRGVRFPDARSYIVEARSPGALTVPTRQTVKRFRVDWSGLTEWGGMPRPRVYSDGSPMDVAIARDGGVFSATGQLVHTLPGPIREALVIVNPGETRIRRPATGLTAAAGMISPATAFRLAGDLRSWEPGEVLDLAEATGRAARVAGESFTLEATLNRVTPTRSESFAPVPQGGPTQSLEDRIRALLFYQHLQPPEFRRGQIPRQVVATRGPMQGVDLSRWLTEPCLIIVGEVEQTTSAPSPVPVKVDGDQVDLVGRTFVAWVYPLPENPPEWPTADDEPDQPEESEGPDQNGAP